MALPFPFPFSKVRIRGIPHSIALPLPFSLPFAILRIISMAFPLPFQHLFPLPFPILRITSVAFSLPFQHLFPVLGINGVAFPPTFPQRSPPPFSVLRVRGVAFPHSFPVLLDRLTPARRHSKALVDFSCHVTDFINSWNPRAAAAATGVKGYCPPFRSSDVPWPSARQWSEHGSIKRIPARGARL
jgi:hypothetical protein